MLKAYLSPYGRRARLTYWRAAAVIPLSAMLALVGASIDLALNVDAMFVSMLVRLVIVLIALWAGLAVAIRRLHDRDRSGWRVLVALVPVLGSIWYLFWNGLRPGTPGSNRFGLDPLARNAAAVAVFDESPASPAPKPRRSPFASTIVAWVLLLAMFALYALLFQNPGQRASRTEALPPSSIER